jgi:hypothetical protein
LHYNNATILVAVICLLAAFSWISEDIVFLNHHSINCLWLLSFSQDDSKIDFDTAEELKEKN